MRKFLTTLLCMIMVFTMMPMATGVAFAVQSDLIIAGEITDCTTKTDLLEYDADNHKLTLTGGTITGTEIGIEYYGTDTLKIIVSGTNYIDVTKVGIYSSNTNVNIEIREGASLTIGTITDINDWNEESAYEDASTYGIHLEKGNLTITNKGTLNIYSKECGILALKDVTITNNGNINMYCCGNETTAAISLGGNLTVDATTNTNSLIINSGRGGILVSKVNNATLTNINATITSVNDRGINIVGKLIIDGNSNINVSSAKKIGIWGEHTVIKGAAKVNAYGGQQGLYSDYLEIDGRNVKVNAKGGMVGIFVVTLNHIKGETNVTAPLGIMSERGDINLIGGKVTTTSTDVAFGEFTVSAGIYAYEGTLNIPSNSDCVIKTTATATNSNLELGIGGTKINIEEGFSGSIEATVYAEVPISNTNAFAPIASGMPPGIGGEYPPTLDTASITDTLTFEVSSSTDTNTKPKKLDNLASLTDGVSEGLYKYVKIAPKPEICTVTFDPKGGSYNGFTEVTVIKGDKATKPEDPTKDGYEFKGWCLNGSQYDFTSPVTESFTLVAKWEEKSAPTPTYHGSSFDYEAYKANLEKLEKEEHEKQVAEVKKAVKNTEFKATSTKQTKLNGKKAVKIKWEVVGGEYSLSDFEGFDVYRSTKRYSGYGAKPFFTTKNWTYTNNKDLKAGKTYYYKVRAWKMVDGGKVYTGWSTKAWRTVK